MWGVRTTYRDVFGTDHEISHETLLAVLRALGAPIETPADAVAATRETVDAIEALPCEPVTVAWADEPVRVPVRAAGDVRCTLSDGTEWTSPLDDGSIVFPHDPGIGRHTLDLDLPDGRSARTIVLRAPRRIGLPSERRWGVFCPVAALRSERDWGVGDLTDLGRLAELTSSFGGDLVATLPLFAIFEGEPSPYSPVSRLAWNELHADPTAEPEFTEDVLVDGDLTHRIRAARERELVDHHEAMRLKHETFERLRRGLSPRRREALERFCSTHPHVDDYARFRGAVARHGPDRRRWPDAPGDGRLGDDDVDPAVYAYHRYVQWVTSSQLDRLADVSRRSGGGLYIDLPVGSSGRGYDVWRYRDAFVPDSAAGAPPDTFFRAGQNWAFPPPHPHRARDDGYAYLAGVFRTVLKYASVLRIDHVMGLHRMWTVPDGMEASEGTYVQHRADELYAVLAIEAHAADAVIVGEDLGTVPAEVRRGMQRHDLLRSWILQYELDPSGMGPIPVASLAALNTHDMDPFAGFWQGRDLDRLEQLGFFDRSAAEDERAKRGAQRSVLVGALRDAGRLPEKAAGEDETSEHLDGDEVRRAAIEHVAASDACLAIITLEDLWGETAPQNVPGTTGRYPNWRRRIRYRLEEVWDDEDVSDTLEAVDRLRKGTHS